MKKILFTFLLFWVLRGAAQHVGINTTDPDRPLTVQGVEYNSELISFRDAGSGRRWHLNIPGMTGLSFNATNQREHVLHISQFGRIGINTHQPWVAFQVNALNDDNLAFFHTDATIGNITTTNASVYNLIGFNSLGGLIGTTSNHNLNFYSNNQRRLTLAANGNFGIGYPSPLFPLHVGGQAKFQEGILLKNEGGQQEVLDYYETTQYATGITANNLNIANSYSFRITRIGNQVTVFLPQERLNLTIAGAQELIMTTELDLRYRPNTSEVRQPIQVLINGNTSTGYLVVKTDGTIILRPAINNPLAIWTGAGNSGFYACSISYIL
jgi:hypothetical protein